jgi:hypothetical protein
MTSTLDEILEGETLCLIISKSDINLIEFIEKNYAQKSNLLIIQKTENHKISELLRDFTASISTNVEGVSNHLSVRYMSTILKNFKLGADVDLFSIKVFVATESKQEHPLLARPGGVVLQENQEQFQSDPNNYICRMDFYSNIELDKVSHLFDLSSSVLLEEFLVNSKTSNDVNIVYLPQNSSINLVTFAGLDEVKKSFFESRGNNRLSLNLPSRKIEKFSLDSQKIKDEYAWYLSLPGKFRSYIPAFVELVADNEEVLQMEFISLDSLSLQYSYKTLPLTTWQEILDKLFSLNKDFRFEAIEISQIAAVNAQGIYLDKTLTRVADLSQCHSGISDLVRQESIVVNGIPFPGLKILMPRILAYLKTLSENATVGIIHGDFCFSNIFYGIEDSIIKLVDPRGTFGSSQNTILGDPRYDIAKLRHSFCGKYDWILEGFFEITRSEEFDFNFRFLRHNDFDDEKVFDQLCIQYEYDPFEIRFIEAYLFLTMIPLHTDSLSRQTAFYLTAMSKFHSLLIANNSLEG